MKKIACVVTIQVLSCGLMAQTTFQKTGSGFSPQPSVGGGYYFFEWHNHHTKHVCARVYKPFRRGEIDSEIGKN